MRMREDEAAPAHSCPRFRANHSLASLTRRVGLRAAAYDRKERKSAKRDERAKRRPWPPALAPAPFPSQLKAISFFSLFPSVQTPLLSSPRPFILIPSTL